jgi:thiamine transport system substrate-binding protein
MKNSLIAALISAVVLSGCSQNEESSSVTLLTHDSFVVSDSLKAKFESETGLTLNIVQAGDTGTVVASAVLSAGSPTADVIFGIDNSLLTRALTSEVFEPYKVTALSEIRAELLEDSQNGMVTPIDFGDVCINVDTAFFEAKKLEAPTRLIDLLKPEYANQLVIQDPAASSPGLAFLVSMRQVFGSGWKKQLQQLKDNGVKIAGSWSDAYFGEFTRGGGSGTFPLVNSYATSPVAEYVYAEGEKPTEVSTTSFENDCFRQIEYAGILRGTQNRSNAEKLMEWLVSREFQSEIATNMFVYPSRSDIEIPAGFVKFGGKVKNPIELSASEISLNIAQWLREWDEVMGN